MSEELKSKFEKEAQDIIKSLLDNSFAVKHIPCDDENWQDGYTNGYITGRLKTLADEWVSVADRRKPKDDQWIHCAALMSNGEYDVLLPSYSYSEKYDTYTGYGEAQQEGRVTHWRHLPKAPNQ